MVLLLSILVDLVDLAHEVYAFVRNVPLDLVTINSKIFGWRLVGLFGVLYGRNHDQFLILHTLAILYFLLGLLERIGPRHFGEYFPKIKILRFDPAIFDPHRPLMRDKLSLTLEVDLDVLNLLRHLINLFVINLSPAKKLLALVALPFFCFFRSTKKVV